MKILLICLLLPFNLFSQKYSPTKENLEAREWFQNAKFGLFIHWGVYSVLGDGECNEGSVWEAALIITSLKLKNIELLVIRLAIKKELSFL